MTQPPRKSWRLLGSTLGLITFACASPTRADVSSSQVLTAIRKGVHYLLKHQQRPKPWEETDLTIEGNGEKGGESALVLESLLTVGQSLHLRSLNIFSPPMQRAIEFVANVQSPVPQGAYGYSWRANGSNSSHRWDNSNSQYGVLGMWAVAHSGLPVPAGYWRRVRRHWVSCQYASGSWGYWQHLNAPGAVGSSTSHKGPGI